MNSDFFRKFTNRFADFISSDFRETRAGDGGVSKFADSDILSCLNFLNFEVVVWVWT